MRGWRRGWTILPVVQFALMQSLGAHAQEAGLFPPGTSPAGLPPMLVEQLGASLSSQGGGGPPQIVASGATPGTTSGVASGTAAEVVPGAGGGAGAVPGGAVETAPGREAGAVPEPELVPPGASPRVPAAGAQAVQPVPWASLSPSQRQLLSSLQGQWDGLPPQRQQALSQGSEHWLQLSPQERQVLRQRWQRFRAQPPPQQQADRENFRRFRNLPPQLREQLRQRWDDATPEQRRDMIEELRARREEGRPGGRLEGRGGRRGR